MRGISLVEVVIAMALLAVAAVVVSQALVAGQMHAYDGRQRLHSTLAGEDLLERILALPYHDPQGASTLGPETGESTPDGFDNLDDYHCYTEAAGVSGSGLAAAAEWDVFERAVTISYVSLVVSGFETPVQGISITVQMTDAFGSQWSLGRFVAEPD